MEKGGQQNPALTSYPESGYYAQQPVTSQADKGYYDPPTVTSQPDNGYYDPPTVKSQPDNGYNAPPSNNSQRYDYNHPLPYAINSRGYSINSGDISTANVNYTTSDGVPLVESGMEVSQAEAPPPSDYLVCAIFVTLFCCLLLGIAAIVYAVESRSAAKAGHLSKAKDKATTAKHLIISGIAIWGISIVSIGVFYAFTM